MTDEQGPSYPNAPLAVVALEVRYPEEPEGVSRRAQSLIRSALKAELPLVENVTHDQVEVALGAPIPPSVQRRTFPRFVTRDRMTALAVSDAAMVLETTHYDGYSRFRPLVESVVNAVAAAAHPEGVLRVGLRYIDEIRIPSIVKLPGDWDGFIDSHLLAAVDSEFLPVALTLRIWQGLVQYSSGPESTLTLRYGPRDGYAIDPRGPTRRKDPPPPGPFFLLDSDSSWVPGDDVPEFNPEQILEICDRLHAPVRALFRAAVTDKLRDEVFSVAREQRVEVK